MDRGVVIGGALICASFLLAVALNHSEVEPKSPAKTFQPVPEVSIDSKAERTRACAGAVPNASAESAEPIATHCE